MGLNHAITSNPFSYSGWVFLRLVLEKAKVKCLISGVFLPSYWHYLERNPMEALYCVFLCLFMLAATIALAAAAVVLFLLIKGMLE